MKSFLAIGCLLLLADVIRAQEKKITFEVLREHVTPCAEELNISPEELSKLEKSELEDEEKTKLGCLNICIMKHMNILEDDEFKREKFQEMMEKYVDADKIAGKMEMLEACLEEVKDKSDECEVGYEFSHCMKLKDI